MKKSYIAFLALVLVFVIAMAAAVAQRGGRDLKVGLFGVQQVLQKKSPYQNPTDPNRTIFRYAPGITILEYPFLLISRMTAPFEFADISPSVMAWYFLEVLALVACGFLLLRLIPSFSDKAGMRNLILSFVLALPLIGYELSNSQNKIPALLFTLAAILFFERNRYFISALLLNLALTVYVPLVFFAAYFIIRSRGRYLLHFLAAAAAVFVLLPGLILGFRFNNFLLKEWFENSLKPFVFTGTYASYIDLRVSSQSLPSAVGRIFVSGRTGNFHYLIPAESIHLIIKILSLAMLLVSCIAVWKRRDAGSRGLEYALFLFLALLLPQYCVYYTWAWVFAVYLAVFNYLTYPHLSRAVRGGLLALVIALAASSYSIVIHACNHLSVLFWGSLFAWGGIASVMLLDRKAEKLL